jgi:hypothetical protein
MVIQGWVQVTANVTVVNVTSLNNFLLDEFFDKSIVRLHYLFILSMLSKYQDD